MKANVEGYGGSVVAADLPDEAWDELRRDHHAARRRVHQPLCTCVDCGHPLHPKQYQHGTRFFAHNPDAPDACILKSCDGESPEHRRLKLSVYRVAKKTRGWDADLEVPAPQPDPVTGKAVIVDVVARHDEVATIPVGTPRLQGWEVQLSPLGEGHLHERHESRVAFLPRCQWITRGRPSWADDVPWYQVATRTEDHPDLVVDGVVRRERIDPNSPASGEHYIVEDPFPADKMVRYILRGAFWAQGIGWQLMTAGGTALPATQRQLRRGTVRGVVAEYCERLVGLPEWARGWSDAEWAQYAVFAHERRRRGTKLGVLDEAAIARFPALDLEDEDLRFGLPEYNHLADTRPCMLCGGIVVVSMSTEFPIHHRCAWYVARGEPVPQPV